MSVPHRIPAPVSAALICAGFFACRLPLAPNTGVAGAFACVGALTIALALLLTLMARLATADVSDRQLSICLGLAATCAYLIRKRGAPGAGFELSFDLALVTAAAAMGRLFVNQVLEAWWIVPLGLTGACADLVSVFLPGGPTQQMIETGSPVLDYLLLVWPNFAPGTAPGFIGVSDFVIAAILYALAARFHLDAWRTLGLLLSALVVCLSLAGIAGIGLPAIPFLFLFFVVGHRRELMESFRTRKPLR